MTLRLTLAALATLVLTAGTVGVIHYWPAKLDLHPAAHLPVITVEDARTSVRMPAPFLLAEVDSIDDELLAYLHYGYLKGRSFRGVQQVLLTYERFAAELSYRVWLEVDSDLLTAVPLLEKLKKERWIPGFRLAPAGTAEIQRKGEETALFAAAYRRPVEQRLEELGAAELLESTQRWVLFKAQTDGRIRTGMLDESAGLSRGQAGQFAADIITVADFYDLPLEFFLGIGAVENNYLDVRGDLEHAVWKRRVEKGDIVLERRKGRFLVLNYSLGTWQITRETLRRAHKLYLRDQRDYTKLPAELRPPPQLDFDSLDPRVLTTYAGLLFRHLLDHFGGDVAKAVGAYNGGIGNPSDSYQQSVTTAAQEARSIIEHAAALNGRRVAEMKLTAAGR